MCALVFEGSCCAICGNPINIKNPYFATSGVAFGPSTDLWRYCDAPMHWECYAQWSERTRFARGYFDSWVESRLTNPYWGTVYLDDEVELSVNPFKPEEEASVNLAAVAWQLRVHLPEWHSWIKDAQKHIAGVHHIVREALVMVLPRIRERFPSSKEILDSFDWEGKRRIAKRLEEERVEAEEVRTKDLARHRDKCIKAFQVASSSARRCPSCGKESSSFRFSDGGTKSKSLLICTTCGCTVSPDTFLG